MYTTISLLQGNKTTEDDNKRIDNSTISTVFLLQLIIWGIASPKFESINAAKMRLSITSCSYLYNDKLTITILKSRFSHCFICLKLFRVGR